MKRWEKAEALAMGAVAVWLVWYELQCPGCRADREYAASQRARERHELRHTARR